MNTVPRNADVAAIFQGIAELLEAKGDNLFKIRAYRNAVLTLETLTDSVADLSAQGKLRKVPGFGEAITAKIGEILQTGTCELYERLKSEQDSASASVSEENTVKASEDFPSPW